MEYEKIVFIFKEVYKFWEVLEMDFFIVVWRCYVVVVYVLGVKFIFLMEKCVCFISILIYKMCKRKDKMFLIGY